ncbi:MAG: YlxR family protein [Ruminococcaceae bacterium]|nr:YlxR family protein [Oscillospiraceae bacterium]
MRSVHEPVRECISCGQKFLKHQLLRVVRNGEGISLDVTGKAAGRGAYLCKDPACYEKLVKQRRLDRAFRQQVSREVYDMLGKQLALLGTEKGSPEE